MSRLDDAEFIRKKIAELKEEEEKEKKEREAFEKASSQEKIEKLRKYIDELGQRLERNIEDLEERLDGHIDYIGGVVEKLGQKYNELLSYVQGTTEEKDYRIVDRKTMLCEAKAGKVHNAILFFHGDDTITVKCSADESCDCKYGSREF